MIPVCVLVVAKAPVPGLAKTRLAAAVGPAAAADAAAAALLDTLDAVAVADVAVRVVALTGDLDAAARGGQLRERLADFTVLPQRGADFAERLVNAHLDASVASAGLPVLQIGMDTPQVSGALLDRIAATLLASEAVLGPAADGGWWVLGIHDPVRAECLSEVPMSRSDTCAVTLRALEDTGVYVTVVDELADVDVIDDVDAVRHACAPESRFRRLELT